MNRLRFGLALLLLLALMAPVRTAMAEGERIALIVGIGAYETVPGLPNPPNDAQAMAEALEALGFEVDHRRDLTNRSFATALREFGIRAAEADVAVIYYAGHGVQVNGVNYLIPADAHLERERDLVYEALPVSLPLGELAQARELGILILDACRNNPFVDRLSQAAGSALDIGAGLARVDDTPSDTMVAMATRANQVAEDGQGNHSPFTQALLQNLKTPGLELSLFFREVRDSVKQATDNRQEPFIYGSLGAEPFYFNPLPPNRAPALQAMTAIEVFDRDGPAPLRIGRPTDPDGDQLVAQVTALPKGGSILVGERLVLIGDYLTVEQLAATSFRPDASHVGDADGFGFAVMDGRGGISRGAVRVAIKPSNTPPVVPAERRLVVAAVPLHVEPPTDPDGDPLTVEVIAVPDRGHVLDGIVPVKEGDRLAPDALLRLSYDPSDAPVGPAGSFTVAVDDGRGGRATSAVLIEVAEPGSMTAAPDPEDAAWQRVARIATAEG
ncbi:caspase family protein, partial [Arenibaculum sp.]|uniref:caspase family protein n=1 Tax=Arenibaculum sp. TaxID=2865862 RepID=UPI002E166E34|nr:caspase family protein [Arenibaculum sp.]